ncbi:16S rRNA (guanine(1207)-N(2))-methyltransferase RsmC [Buchnera aphidicola]|uniref:16S rRNA (guanine(1207)-N(2))-methyltransferase RsmC n=1 Tax=Buchnera aphidicola TaxID=9 RepID=UPI003463BAB0
MLIDESKVVIKNLNNIQDKTILFSGNIHDNIFHYFNNKNNKIHLQKYYDKKIINNIHNDNYSFRMLPKKSFILNCKILVFFWFKNKNESIFQLKYLLSILDTNSEIFVVGKNKLGINSIKKMFHNIIEWVKIDYQKKCSLYYGKIKKKIIFQLKKYFHQHELFNFKIMTLPGIFGYKNIDFGSMTLIDTFNKKIKGEVLDIGSGSGILSIAMKKISQNLKITLVDNNSTALICSKYNLIKNKISGNVYYSNIFSNVKNKFNLIISNPPTHYNNGNNLNIIYKIIKESKKFLYKKGELRIVLHSNISCKKILNKTFGNYKILIKKKHFNVYQSIYK